VCHRSAAGQLNPVHQLNPPAGVVDLVGLELVFSNTTGDYEITLYATPQNPFIGGFRVNVLLFNPDTGSLTPDPALFVDSLNDFVLATASTEVTITGTDPRLLAWDLGDRVATCHGASFVELGPCTGDLGTPTGGAAFAAGVYSYDHGTPFGAPAGTDVFFSSPPGVITR